MEPIIHAKFDQSVYWTTGKKAHLGYSIYSKDGGEFEWYLSAARLASKDVFPQIEVGFEFKEKKILQSGWNHFTAVIPAKMTEGKYFLFLAKEPRNSSKFFPFPMVNQKHTISFPHIGTHYRFYPADATLTVLDLNKKRFKVGYIEGAGDIMDETLENLGYEVVRISESTPEFWSQVEVILVGIRAFNTEKWLMNSGDRIKGFVEGGGNFVVTYTTAGRSGIELPTPLSLTIGRDRVTEEDAPITLLNHLVLQKPNKIQSSDFDFWVQERGLYFPKSYDGFNEVLSIKESTGINYTNSTVVGHYGKGSVIYTGLSLFRELPAGVPGAMKLLKNILHYDY